MPFQVPSDEWERRTSAMATSFTRLEAFPPVIVEYRAGELLVADGNHRVGAFEKLGLQECWVILWFPDDVEKQHYDRTQ